MPEDNTAISEFAPMLGGRLKPTLKDLICDTTADHPITRRNKSAQPNFVAIDFGPCTMWFSYRTIIGVKNSTGLWSRENKWGPTTGSHINEVIGNRDRRLPDEEFNEELYRTYREIAEWVNS